MHSCEEMVWVRCVAGDTTTLEKESEKLIRMKDVNKGIAGD